MSAVRPTLIVLLLALLAVEIPAHVVQPEDEIINPTPVLRQARQQSTLTLTILKTVTNFIVLNFNSIWFHLYGWTRRPFLPFWRQPSRPRKLAAFWHQFLTDRSIRAELQHLPQHQLRFAGENVKFGINRFLSPWKMKMTIPTCNITDSLLAKFWGI